MKYVFLAALLFIAGLALTQVPRKSYNFTPLVRVRTTNGLFITLVQKQISSHERCDAAVDVLVKEFGKQCPQCVVESTECAVKLDGIDSALARRESVPLYVVAADELRIGILGPPESVRSQCEGMASSMVRNGVSSAICVPPAKPS